METYLIVIDALTSNGIELSEQERAGIRQAFGSRGQYKGYLKKDVPARDKTLARVCWLAIQPNHYKVSIPSIMMLSDVERTTYDKLSKINFPACLDKDMESLQNMGVW